MARTRSSRSVAGNQQPSIRKFFSEMAEGCGDDDDDTEDDELDNNSDDDYENDSFLVPSDDEEEEDEKYQDDGEHNGRAQGVLPDSLEDISESSVVVVVSPQKKPRGRPSKKKMTVQQEPEQEKQLGHATFPVNDFSMTISRSKGDVDLSLLDAIHAFFVKYCIKGGVSTEVGHRAHNLHYQGLFRTRYPKDKNHVSTLTKMFKEMVKPRTGYRILIKPFAPQQTIQAMIGYITKDDGKKFLSCCVCFSRVLCY